MATINQGNGFPMVAKKIYPNDPCECGSGKKAKRCCGTETTYYYSKLNASQKAAKEKEEELKRLRAEKEKEVAIPMG